MSKPSQKTTRQMCFPELPHYLTVNQIIDHDTNTVSVEIESTVHVNRLVKMPTSFTIDFVRSRPGQFSADVLNFIVKRYGLTLEPVRYS